VFLGTHRPRLDDKGRLFLPARFRDDLAEGLVITKGQDRCLCVYPRPEFDRMAETLSRAPGTAKGLRDYSRVFFGSASDETPDKQGRLTLPQELRTYAGLDRDVVVVGVNTRVEIWDSTAWDAALSTTEPVFAASESEVLPGLL
jgi:MraZ protein